MLENAPKVHIVSVMDPTNLWCRNHTLLMARAMCEDFSVTILSNGSWALTEEECSFFPKNCAPELKNIYAYFDDEWCDTDFILYQLANNDHFIWIAECFMRHPGAVLMHDISLFWLLCQVTGLKYTFIEEELGLENGIMLKNALDWSRPKLASMAVHSAYFNRAILQFATGIVTHSAYQASVFKRKFPELPVHSVALVPNFLQGLVPLDERTNLADERARLGIPAKALTFGILGFQAFHKRLPELLSGFCDLDPMANVRILLVGKWDKEVRAQCASSLQVLEARGWLVLVDRYVHETELETFISISDVVANFRYPTAGESSGIAAQVLAMGVPLMVNKIGSFVDLPEGSVIRIPFSATGEEHKVVGTALRQIIEDPDFLREKQQAARANVGFYKMARYRADYVPIIKAQMVGYAERRAKGEKAQAGRRENDQWDGGKRFVNGNIAVVYDELGNGLLFRDSMLTPDELLTLINGDFLDNPRRGRDRQAFVQSSALAQLGEAFHIGGGGLDPAEVGALVVAVAPRGESADIYEYLRFLRQMVLGSKCLLPADVVEMFGLCVKSGASKRGQSVTGYRSQLLADDKYPAELGAYANGLHLIGDCIVHDKRFVRLRRGANVGLSSLP